MDAVEEESTSIASKLCTTPSDVETWSVHLIQNTNCYKLRLGLEKDSRHFKEN